MGRTEPRSVIDIETLEVWNSVKECSRATGVSSQAICRSIVFGWRVGSGIKRTRKGRRLEYLDYWLTAYTPAEKEKHARQNGFYFL